MTPSPYLPPLALDADGRPRRVGVEVELSGLEIEDIVSAVVDRFGGEVDRVSDFEQRVKGSSVGDFRVELDYEYLKTIQREGEHLDGILAEVHRLSIDAMAEVLKLVVPMEVVSPPLPPERLGEVDALIEVLRRRGGRGTRHSAVYAFGLHLNPEVPALDAAVLLRYLRAYLCLHEWLVDVEDVDWSRRMTPYINPFPRDYVLEVLDARYAPDMDDLIDGYLRQNADRNRALDLLPLFAHLDAARVRAAVPDPRIKPRPTFHYRLPNCDVDVPGWGVSQPWRNWLEVERLAEDAQRLDAIRAAYREHLDSYRRFTEDWGRRARDWMT